MTYLQGSLVLWYASSRQRARKNTMGNAECYEGCLQGDASNWILGRREVLPRIKCKYMYFNQWPDNCLLA